MTSKVMENRHSIRMEGYDYSGPGAYFITICTRKKVPIFGRIANNDEIHLNEVGLLEVGLLAEKFWLEIPRHFLNMGIEKYVIMPDHLHGIIIIREKDTESNGVIITDGRDTAPWHSLVLRVCRAPTEDGKVPCLECFHHPVKGSIPTIIRSYKFAILKKIHKINPNQLLWQRGYYEHVIRSEKKWGMIHDYIAANPLTVDREGF